MTNMPIYQIPKLSAEPKSMCFRKLRISLCITWDGFHVYVNSNLKNYFSFKKRYLMTSLDLVGYNKRFLYTLAGASGSACDARLLKESSIYTAILDGDIMPEKVIRLGDFG